MTTCYPKSPCSPPPCCCCDGCAHAARRAASAAPSRRAEPESERAERIKTALERQNLLNQHSDNGVYLLPAARSAARLQSSLEVS